MLNELFLQPLFLTGCTNLYYTIQVLEIPINYVRIALFGPLCMGASSLHYQQLLLQRFPTAFLQRCYDTRLTKSGLSIVKLGKNLEKLQNGEKNWETMKMKIFLYRSNLSLESMYILNVEFHNTVIQLL